MTLFLKVGSVSNSTGSPVATNPGVGGDYFGSRTTVTLTASQESVIPEGLYIVMPDTAHATLEFNGAAYGVSPTAWTAVMAKGSGGMIMSDGVSWKLVDDGSGSTSYLVQVR